MSQIRSKIAGVSFKNDNGTDRQSIIRRFVHAGDPLILVREPHNRFSEDGSAVAVYIRIKKFWFFTSHEQLGYLGSNISGEVAAHMDSRRPVKAVVSDVTGGAKGKSIGVNIIIELIGAS